MTPDPMLKRLAIAGWVLAAAAVLLAFVAVWLAVDNPEIGDTSRGDHYPCLAPWDTVLNGANNYPGGEPPPDGDEIAARCRAAGEDRFGVAVTFAVAAVLAGAAAAGVVYRRERRDRRPSS